MKREVCQTFNWPAASWKAYWDRQQQVYVRDRERRFSALIGWLADFAGAEPQVLDLGCGPGSLGDRLVASLPGARVTGLDFDPVLLALARADTAADDRRDWVEADLRKGGWIEALGGRRFDAVVSSTALHWLGADELTALYSLLAQYVLKPGGVFLNADHVQWALGSRLEAAVTRMRLGWEDAALAAGEASWPAWWEALKQGERGLSSHFAERTRRFADRQAEQPITADFHLAALRQAGFVEAAVVWAEGDDVILAALASGGT